MTSGICDPRSYIVDMSFDIRGSRPTPSSSSIVPVSRHHNMPQSRQKLRVKLSGETFRFPAFVHLPTSARPDKTHLLTTNNVESVKLIYFSANLDTVEALVPNNRHDVSFKRQIADRWGIDDSIIHGLAVNVEDRRFLIENDDDWQEWAEAVLLQRVPTYLIHETMTARSLSFEMEPVDLDVIVDAPAHPPPSTDSLVVDGLPQGADVLPNYCEASSAVSETASSIPTIQELISRLSSLATDVHAYSVASRPSAIESAADVTTQQEPEQTGSGAQGEESASGPEQTFRNRDSMPYSTQPGPDEHATRLVNYIAFIGRTLQSHLQGYPQLEFLQQPILSSLPNQLVESRGQTTRSDTSISCLNATASSTMSAPSQTGAPAITAQESGATTQRQSLIEGMFNELARVRAQQAPASEISSSPQASQARSTTESSIENELSRGFAQMLAAQASDALNVPAATAAAATPATPAADAASASGPVPMADAAPLGDRDDEEFDMVSDGPSLSRGSSGSRSARRGRSSRWTGTTMLLVAMITCILGFVSSATASPHSALNRTTHLQSRSSAPNRLVSPRQNSRHLHLCKCTCFQTNSTLVPLYSPADAAKPCLTCTRQFCLDQGLEMCKGAKLEHTDHDVGTGFEGDVWAKCFERDSYKDQGIITLYILVVGALVACAAFRGRMQSWYQRYHTFAPRRLYDAVRESPWRTTAR